MALANEDVAAFVDVELELLALGEPWDSKLAFWSSTLMLIKYWASATASGAPVIVMVLSEEPLSRSSQFEMRIMAPEICLISAILVPPLPMTQPINSFGTVISVVC